MRMRAIAAAAVAAGVVAAGAAAPSVVAAGRTTTVKIADVDFVKPAVTIRRGDSVKWVWADGRIQHDVKSKGSPRFRSSALKSTGTHQVRFTKKGTYRYICSIHPNMLGRVVVR